MAPAGQQQYGQYQQNQQQPPKQPKAAPTIAKRPADASPAAPAAEAPKVEKAGGTKVLSIGGDPPKPQAEKALAFARAITAAS